VLALHGTALLLLREHRLVTDPVPPVDAVLLDLTPATPIVPDLPSLLQQPTPEAPSVPEPPPTPPPPVVQASPLPPPIVPDAMMPPLLRPAPPVTRMPPPRPAPKPRPVSLPLASTAPDMPRPSPAPAPSSLAAQPSPPGPEASTWPSRVASHLLRFRHYPPDAERRGFTGVTTMRFSVDLSGRIVSASVVQSSGHDMLDGEAVLWLQRAQPLPPPPPDKAAPAQITVPLSFVLR
jgi:protein TonB